MLSSLTLLSDKYDSRTLCLFMMSFVISLLFPLIGLILECC